MDTSLRKTIIAALAVFAVSSLWIAASYSKTAEPASFRSFQVTGQGSAAAIPDIADFSFGTLTEGGLNVASLQEENAEKLNAAISYLKEQGVEEKDIATKEYSVQPRYQYSNCFEAGDACPPPEIVGYRVQERVQVKVRNFGILGGLLSGVVAKGANTVSSLSFTIDDPTPVENEAREKAFAKARTKADAMAEAGGFQIGRLLSVQEGTPSSPVYDHVSLERGAAPAPSIEPGSTEVEVALTLTFEIR